MNTTEKVKIILGEINPETRHDNKVAAENYNELLRQMKETAFLDYYHPIRSDRKIIGPFIVLFKRLMRRLLKNIFLPLIDRQNKFNALTIAVLESCADAGDETRGGL